MWDNTCEIVAGTDSATMSTGVSRNDLTAVVGATVRPWAGTGMATHGTSSSVLYSDRSRGATGRVFSTTGARVSGTDLPRGAAAKTRVATGAIVIDTGRVGGGTDEVAELTDASLDLTDWLRMSTLSVGVSPELDTGWARGTAGLLPVDRPCHGAAACRIREPLCSVLRRHHRFTRGVLVQPASQRRHHPSVRHRTHRLSHPHRTL